MTGTHFDDSWLDEWRKHTHPFPLGKNFYVIPAWDEGAAPEGRTPLILHDRKSFGIGTHPTTQLVLEQLEDDCSHFKRDTFLDVGHGSGILCIAAEKLGFKNILGVDTDENALTAAEENRSRNNCSVCRFLHGSLESVSGRFGYIVCNMISSAMLELSPSVLMVSEPGSRIVLSGFLPEERKNVERIFFLDDVVSAERDGWGMLAGTLRAS